MPAERATRAVSTTTDMGTSSCATTTAADEITSRSDSVRRSRLRLAAPETTIEFSPSGCTVIKAVPLGPSVRRTSRASIPASVIVSSRMAAASSLPSAVTNVVRASARADATAWLSPLPPGCRLDFCASTVSPAAGMCGTP